MDAQPPSPNPDPYSTTVPPLARTNVLPPQLPPAATTRRTASPGYTGLVLTSWVLLGGTTILSVIPFLGFGTWLIAVPVFTTTLVLGILVLTRGATMSGILILVATVCVVPLFIVLAPVITTAIVSAATNFDNESSSTQTIATTPNHEFGEIVIRETLIGQTFMPPDPMNRPIRYPITSVSDIKYGDRMEATGAQGVPEGTIIYPIRATVAATNGQSATMTYYFFQNEFNEWKFIEKYF